MKRLDHRELVVIVRADWANNVDAAQKRGCDWGNYRSLSDQTMLTEDLERAVQGECFYGTALATNRSRFEE